MAQFKYIILGSALLTACAQAPVSKTAQQVPAANPHEPQRNSQVAHGDPYEPPANPHEDETEQLPNVELTDEVLYEFLLTEIANQRGQTALAAKSSSELAKKSRDPRLARRAAQLAIEAVQIDPGQAGTGQNKANQNKPDQNKPDPAKAAQTESTQREAAIEAIRLWQELEPDSILAKRMLASMLLRSNKLDEARKELIEVLQAEGDQAGELFLQIYQMLIIHPDAAAALKLMHELAQRYPVVAEAHWSVARLALASGDEKLALDEVRLARSLRPSWDMAVSLEAQVLQVSAPQQGLDVLRRYLSAYPEEREIRMQYARTLLDQKQYKLGREEFQRLADESPGNPELAYTIALISLQMNDLEGAETQLKRALSKGKKDRDTVQYYLGQLSEAKNEEQEATTYYRAVQAGEYLFPAQVRIVYLLSKRGQLAEARSQLQLMQPANGLQRKQMVLVEAQILREAKQFDQSYQVLQQGLTKLPDDPDLLYGSAMMAEKMGQPDLFEQLMRKLIQIKPDHAHAYNALGYSLLERNERIPEAVALVEKALQLAPDDEAILDSVGWGYYRTGKLDESVKMLRRAFAGNPDPEVAAHLGEVLWVRGDKSEARKIWQDSLQANPDNPYLQAVIKKFMP